MDTFNISSLPPVSLLKSSVAELTSQLATEKSGHRIFVGVLDGRAMQDWQGVFECFGNALHFPDYYGSNLNALLECLEDLEWLPYDGYVVVIEYSEKLLAREPPDDTKYFVDLLTNEVADYWSRPINLGEIWDRPSKPFRILMRQQDSHEQSLHPAIASLPVCP